MTPSLVGQRFTKPLDQDGRGRLQTAQQGTAAILAQQRRRQRRLTAATELIAGPAHRLLRALTQADNNPMQRSWQQNKSIATTIQQ